MLIYRGGMPDTMMNTYVKYSSLFAAMVHDYQHGGLNNDFLIKTHHPFALLYNDQSPLENHHCAATCKLIYDEEFRYLPVGLLKLAGFMPPHPPSRPAEPPSEGARTPLVYPIGL